MSSSAEETYSTMFSSLRHPARRKILRMLSDKSMTFSQMLEELEIPGSHLTYHLENLGELVVKMEDGKYKLSSFGKASVSMMKGAEEVPNSQTKKFSALPLRWKSLVAALLIGIVLLSSVSYVQFASFNQLSADYGVLKADFEKVKALNTSADRGMNIIKDVFQIDVAEYQTTLLSNTVEARSDLAGVVEQVLKYSFAKSDSKFDLVLRFRNNHFSLFELSLLEGLPYLGPIYVQPQSTDILEATKNIIERYKSITGEPYLDEMSRILASANETGGEQTLGNTKLKITVYGENAEVLFMYTKDGFDFSAKSLRLVFQNHVLQELSDDWFLYTVSDAQVTVSREQAIQTARDAAKNFEWTADGVQVSNFNVLADPVSAVFFPHPRAESSLSLVPYWYITLYLDKEYPGGVNSITVGVWADNGQIANIQALSGQAGT
jgi:DNA-binding transcriptional ArsR family regulator